MPTENSYLTESHQHTTRCWWHPSEARWVCAAAEPTDPDQLVDVRDMIVVHTAMLREFRLAPAAVARIPAGAAKHAAGVDDHLAFLCELLHHHHEGEDTLLWPPLRARVPSAALNLIEEGESQHVGIDAALQSVAVARAEWRRAPSLVNRDVLVSALQLLYDRLRVHLDFEESALLPLAAGVLSKAEWDAIGEAAATSMPKPALMLAFGMFAYEGDPAVLRAMLSSAPAVPRFVIPRIAPHVYARRARLVHGTSRP